MWYLYHRLGIQSNIVVAAEYARNKNKGSGNDSDGDDNDDEFRLSRPAVLNALRTVVEANAGLRLVGVATPSPRNGRHTMHIAMLHEVDLEGCVEFIEEESSGITAEQIERAHNQWYFDEPDRPWFKLWVINGRTLVFIFHHLVADGRSGYTFHQQFLASLNSTQTSDDTLRAAAPAPAPSWIVSGNATTADIPHDYCDLIRQGQKLGKPWKPSTLEAFWPVLVTWILQLLFGGRFVLAGLPPTKPYPKSATAVAEVSQRTESRISLGRIPAEEMDKILSACRANKTTFTPLLATMIMITLVADYYPDAALGGTRIAYDLRRHLPEPLASEERFRIGNRVGGITKGERVGKFKQVVNKFAATTVTKVDDTKQRVPELDAAGVWELTRSCKEWLEAGIDGNARTQSSSSNIAPDLEDYLSNIMPMVGVSLRTTFLVSNTGVFAPHEETSKGTDRWKIVDVAFSAAPTNGNQGSRGPIFSAATLLGGDVAIIAGYEEGVVGREMGQAVIDATIRRMMALAG